MGSLGGSYGAAMGSLWGSSDPLLLGVEEEIGPIGVALHEAELKELPEAQPDQQRAQLGVKGQRSAGHGVRGGGRAQGSALGSEVRARGQGSQVGVWGQRSEVWGQR